MSALLMRLAAVAGGLAMIVAIYFYVMGYSDTRNLHEEKKLSHDIQSMEFDKKQAALINGADFPVDSNIDAALKTKKEKLAEVEKRKEENGAEIEAAKTEVITAVNNMNNEKK